jgi:hypothetical protein
MNRRWLLSLFLLLALALLKRLGRRDPPVATGHTRTTASSGEQRREFFRLRAAAPFQEASQRAGRPHRVAGHRRRCPGTSAAPQLASGVARGSRD